METDCLGESVTCVQPGGKGDVYLASTLDSKLRLMGSRTGGCLQTFKDEGFAMTFIGLGVRWRRGELCGQWGEDGRVFVWDVLTGEVRARVWHWEEGGGGGEVLRAGEEKSKKDVVSVVAWNQMRKQWASAGGDGTVVVWGMGE